MSELQSSADRENLLALSESLLASAREASAHRAAHTVHGHGGEGMLRQTAIALLAGAELQEHSSPPEATLQMLTGRLRVDGDGRHWELDAGDLIAIPPERHSVTALADSVFLLTARRAAEAS